MNKTPIVTVVLLCAVAPAYGQRRAPGPDAERRQQHQQFQSFVEGVIGRSAGAIANDREHGDFKTLQWLLRDYRKHIADGNWSAADSVKARMNVALQRMEIVATDAPRRQETQKQKQDERRHRELKKQLARQHQEQMQQQQRQHQERMTRQHVEKMNQIRNRSRAR